MFVKTGKQARIMKCHQDLSGQEWNYLHVRFLALFGILDPRANLKEDENACLNDFSGFIFSFIFLQLIILY